MLTRKAPPPLTSVITFGISGVDVIALIRPRISISIANSLALPNIQCMQNNDEVSIVKAETSIYSVLTYNTNSG